MRFALLLMGVLLTCGCGFVGTATKQEFKTVGASIGTTVPPATTALPDK